ncbi:hypothetical protein TCDM_08426 [Trypanosoma cruzi Dm28c]|uniref:Uncharacterized protein n=1 Tax=Trypanosoma cruzi Dm28c TaxID=1416333 RepID=V5BGU5_TRYCR|nr:hypothetical protein TCDM_08426 [Trypanosoma cruzi Dm28c]
MHTAVAGNTGPLLPIPFIIFISIFASLLFFFLSHWAEECTFFSFPLQFCGRDATDCGRPGVPTGGCAASCGLAPLIGGTTGLAAHDVWGGCCADVTDPFVGVRRVARQHHLAGEPDGGAAGAGRTDLPPVPLPVLRGEEQVRADAPAPRERWVRVGW